MKRKSKFVLTVATLCMSLALLVFGVYAATSVSFTIGGTVAYELKDVLVDVNTNFYYSTDNTVLEGEAITTKAVAVAGETLPTDLSSVQGFTAKNVSTYKNGQVVELTEEEKTISGLQVNFGRYNSESENKKSYSYYLVMAVTNYGENPVAVNIVDNTTAENVEKLSTTAINFVNNDVNIAKNETKKVVIAFNILDLTQGIETSDFAFVVTIAEAENKILAKPTINITNRSSTGSWTITTKETTSLATQPTQDDYTINALENAQLTQAELTTETEKEVVLNGAKLDSTNKYYSFQVVITVHSNSRTVYVDYYSRENVSREGYNITWSTQGATGSGGWLSLNRNVTCTITCVIELTGSPESVSFLEEDLLYEPSLGDLAASAGD